MLRHGIPFNMRRPVQKSVIDTQKYAAEATHMLRTSRGGCSISCPHRSVQALVWETAVRETMTKGKRICSAAGLLLTLSLVEGAGICQYQYRNSVPYRYEKAVERADACYADGKWQEAYEAYAEALSYESGDGEVLRRAVLTNLERVKKSGNPRT